MKNITVKEINDMIWLGNWQGKVDSDAMRERLRELLYAEKAHSMIISNITDAARTMNKLLSYGK
jgi:hypothetical protein